MAVLPKAGAPWVLASILILIGIYLLTGGLELITLGGSPYYVICGASVLAAGLLLWRARRLGMWLYGAMIAGAILWALWEVGLDGWGLAARLIGPCVLGLWFLLPHVRRGLV